MASQYTVEGVAFGPQGVQLTYISGTDVRAEGGIFQQHTISISWEQLELAPLMTAVEDAATDLLREAIIAWAQSKPVDLAAGLQDALDEDEEDEGMGGGER